LPYACFAVGRRFAYRQAGQTAAFTNVGKTLNKYETPYMVNIHKATISEVDIIVDLARNIYKEYYLHLWHSGGAKWYMEDYAYSLEKIKLELMDSNNEYFIATENGSEQGYMKINLNEQLPGFETLNALEVERIYLYKKAAGKGLGKQFMQTAMNKARELKKDIIFLKAMDSSTDALEFYKKLGYEICGSLQLPLPTFHLMKEEYRGMVILKKSVEQ
jgi:GNAT superfamily N-acetyltransferase